MSAKRSQAQDATHIVLEKNVAYIELMAKE
jgi:hypothetical protein